MRRFHRTRTSTRLRPHGPFPGETKGPSPKYRPLRFWPCLQRQYSEIIPGDPVEVLLFHTVFKQVVLEVHAVPLIPRDAQRDRTAREARS